MFLENMQTAATQVCMLFIMALVGFICDKAKLYTEKTAKATTDLLFYIIVPCVIIKSFLTMEFSKDMLMKFLLSLALGFATHFIAFALNVPFFSKKKGEENAVYKYASVYGNAGYMALPLAQAILGAEGVFYCSCGVIAFNVLCFTHGVKIMSKKSEKFNLKRLILNPGVISVIIGMPLFLSGVRLPEVITEPISSIASLNTPLAMIIFGTFLANADLKTMFTDKKIYLVCVLKLLVLPAIVVALYRICGVTGSLLTACTITASVPSANNTVLFSAKFERNEILASKTVTCTSVLSILTMPVFIALAQSV